MQFQSNNQAIYLQIADYICEKILLKEWKEEDKIPSVRELAIQLAVNPNTVARTYDFLKQQNIIYDKRGVGYFVQQNAFKNARAFKFEAFEKNDMPFLFRMMNMLGVEVDDLKSPYEKFKKNFPSK